MILFIFSLIQIVTAAPRPSVTLIQQVEIYDGYGGPKSAPMDVELTGDLITRIAPRLQSKATKTIDGRGRFLIPGLIDAHVHLRSVPGSAFREMTNEQIKHEQTLQLRAYLAAGVTTVLDAASPESLVREAAALERDTPGPRIVTLAPFVTPKGGYFATEEMRGSIFADLWPPVTSAADVTKLFADAARLKPFGAKATVEDGFGPVATWPIFDSPMLKHIEAEASKNDFPLFVHSETAKEHRIALSMHPYALVHAGGGKEVLDDKIIAEMKHADVFVITTVALQKIIGLMWHPEIATDPWLRRLVPPDQLRVMTDKKIRGRIVGRVATVTGPPFLPGFIIRMFASMFMNEKVLADQDANGKQSLLKLHEAGLPLVLGSDAGNWPVWSTFFHGASTIVEIESLREAGWPADAVLVAATTRAAKMLKLQGQVGAVREGLIADLVLLKKDPAVDPAAFRDVELVFKSGVGKSPDGWMSAPN